MKTAEVSITICYCKWVSHFTATYKENCRKKSSVKGLVRGKISQGCVHKFNMLWNNNKKTLNSTHHASVRMKDQVSTV